MLHLYTKLHLSALPEAFSCKLIHDGLFCLRGRNLYCRIFWDKDMVKSVMDNGENTTNSYGQ